MTPRNPRTADTLTLARSLACVVGGGVLIAGALGWGRRGLLSSAAGVLLSLVNVWALARMATRAVGSVSTLGPGASTSQLTAALGAKTVVLFTAVWAFTRIAHLEAFPFALGLLVSVAALLGAGLMNARRAELEDAEPVK